MPTTIKSESAAERMLRLRDEVDRLSPQEIQYELVKAIYDLAIQAAGIWEAIDDK
jgi:hypothetical protein